MCISVYIIQLFNIMRVLKNNSSIFEYFTDNADTLKLSTARLPTTYTY